MFVLHLIPNRIRTLYACFNLIFEAHLVKFGTNRCGELLKEGVTLRLR